METILQIKGLRKSYKKTKALKGIDIQVKKGQVYGILGPNGSGKTTTLGILLGVIKQDAGSYSWFEKGALDENRIHIGALLETPNFYPYLNAVDNLKIVAAIKSIKNTEERIKEVLQQVELWTRRKTKFKGFSLGMKQRLAIGSALLSNPEVLILDEPTNGLDPKGIAEIRELILNIAREGKTIIIASHILDEIEKMCTHLAILKEGQLIREGSIEEILTDKMMLSISADSNAELIKTIQEIKGIHIIKEEGHEIFIAVEEDISPAQVNRLIAEKGLYLSSLNVNKQNLESKFLEIIDK